MMSKIFYRILMLNNQPSVWKWKQRIRIKFPSLTHRSWKIQEDALPLVSTESLRTLISTYLNQIINAPFSSANAIERKISLLNHRLYFGEKETFVLCLVVSNGYPYSFARHLKKNWNGNRDPLNLFVFTYNSLAYELFSNPTQPWLRSHLVRPKDAAQPRKQYEVEIPG